MRKWYKKRGGYVKLPRIPWGQRPSWYVKPRPRTTPIFRPPSYTKYVNTEAYNELLDKIEENKYKNFEKDAIIRKHRVKRVTTVPLTPEQRKLLEVTVPKSSRNKKVQSPKGASSWNKKKFTQLESQQQEQTNQIGQEMPRVRQRYRVRTPRGVFRGRRPRVPLRRNLRPRRPRRRTMMTFNGTGSTFSAFSRKLRASRYKRERDAYRVLRTAPWNKYRKVSAARCYDSYSLQSAIVYTVMDETDMNLVKAMLPTTTDDSQILLKGTKQHFHLTNMQKSNVFVHIYECMYRKNSSKTLLELWSNGLADMIPTSPPTFRSYGMTPFMSQAFTQMVKVQKVHTLELAQGRSHRHTSSYTYNRVFDFEEVSEQTDDYKQLWTRAVMFVFRGCPVNDQTTETTVVTAPTAVDIVTDKQIEFKYYVPYTRELAYNNTLALTGVTPVVMDIGSGEEETATSA